MDCAESNLVESDSIAEFARIMTSPPPPGDNSCATRARVVLDPDNVKKGLGQLVLTLVKLIHELMARQAIRRMDAGSLTSEQVERIGLTLLRQAEEIERLCKEFGLEEKDLNLDLGPLGKLL